MFQSFTKSKPKNNEEYRQYLTHNAINIMNKTSVKSYVANNDPNGFVYKEVEHQRIPHLYESVHDTRHPYGYETNAVKNNYLLNVAARDNEKLKFI